MDRATDRRAGSAGPPPSRKRRSKPSLSLNSGAAAGTPAPAAGARASGQGAGGNAGAHRRRSAAAVGTTSTYFPEAVLGQFGPGGGGGGGCIGVFDPSDVEQHAGAAGAERAGGAPAASRSRGRPLPLTPLTPAAQSPADEKPDLEAEVLLERANFDHAMAASIHPDVSIRKFARRWVLLLRPADIEIFDRICDAKEQYELSSALAEWGKTATSRSLRWGGWRRDFGRSGPGPNAAGEGMYPNGDALVKLAYGPPTFDYVLTFDAGDESARASRCRALFERSLLEKGLMLERDPSLYGGNIYVKILAPFDFLCAAAEMTKLKARLKPITEVAENTPCFLVRALDSVFGHTMPKNVESSRFRTSQIYSYIPFTSLPGYESPVPADGPPAQGFDPAILDFFSSAARASLVYDILIRPTGKPGHIPGKFSSTPGARHSFGLAQLVDEGAYKSAFALHDGNADCLLKEGNAVCERALLLRLYRDNLIRGRQPIALMRHYFGEHVALYFAWLGYYNTWLVIASLAGLSVFVYGLLEIYGSAPSAMLPHPLAKMKQDISRKLGQPGPREPGLLSSSRFAVVFDNDVTPFFSLFMCAWATCFLECWKRKAAFLTFEWGVNDYRTSEMPRPQFKGTRQRISRTTGKPELYTPRSRRKLRIFASSAVGFVSAAIVTMFAILVLPLTVILEKRFGFSEFWSSVCIGVVTFILIEIFKTVYARIAFLLTSWENHRTQTEFDDALISKAYLFEFVNNYACLFYLVFIQPTFGARIFKGVDVQEVCHYGDTCMADVTVQLATIFISKQAVRQAQHAFVPWWRARKARREHSWAGGWMKPGKAIPQWELDETLPPWKKGVFEEYDSMVVQFGFITLFVPAFPLAPLLALISNLVEVRSDATKLLKRVQRPVARRAQNIGKWQDILEVVSWVAVPTNAWMIAFQSTVADRWLATLLEPDPAPIAGVPHLVVRLAFVLFFQNAVMILKFILMQMISDRPEMVTMAIDRQDYIAALLKDEIGHTAELAAL